MSALILCAVLAQPGELPPTAIDKVVDVSSMPGSSEEAEGFIMIPDEGDEVGFVKGSIRYIAKKWKAKEFGPAIAAIIMLLLTLAHMLVRRLGKSIQKEWMPHISIASGIGVGLAIQLASLAAGAGFVDWLSAIGQGLLVGLGAVGAWEWLGKRFLKDKVEKVQPKPPTP